MPELLLEFGDVGEVLPAPAAVPGFVLLEQPVVNASAPAAAARTIRVDFVDSDM
ncbi:MAG: hypothetical protein M3N95_13765 [Actinomycetota bacterium]|nr:hypothetical protein [Actinomycetota bacterium]